MNTKAKGTRAEHKSMKLLESLGYQCVRSSASLGAFDVVAIGPTDIILLQCKVRDWPSAIETEAIRLFPAPASCRKLIHRWKNRQSLPDVREIN